MKGYIMRSKRFCKDFNLKKSFCAVFVFSIIVSAVYADNECGTSMCGATPVNQSSQGNYSVLFPIGDSTIKQISPSRKLDTLDGKTIAVVGGSFMARVTHPEIKRLIQQHYPTAKVLLLNEIGSAGVWPGPGVVRQAKDEFQRKLKEYNVHAVISGNGGCGLCTPKEMGSCIAAEYLGIPSVMIASESFAVQARSTANKAGVPAPRVAIYPGSFSAHSEEELRRNTREVLWPQIVSALIKPVTAEELKAGTPDKNTAKKIVYSGTLEEVNRYFSENGWTDGLPIVPPTAELVAEFLKYTDLDPDFVIVELPVAYRKITPRIVAVNGAMAGCPPEFMPILIAFAKAMKNGDFRRTLASTHAWTPYCWLNGPVARQLGIDCGQGEISTQKNAVIGRFINLAMLNLGGYYIKENRMGTFGYLMPWCLTENEEVCLKIGWKPWHMQNGYGLNENTLTAASALNWGNNLAAASSDAERIADMLAWDIVEKQQFALGSGTPFVYRTVLMTEFVARDLSKKFHAKKDLEDALVSKARRPLTERVFANYWGNPGSAFNPERYPMQNHSRKLAASEKAETTATPPWLQWSGKENMETVPVMQKGKTAFLITGDSSRNKSMTLPGGGFALVKIELPANWDKLMAELGYKPLSEYFLKSDLAPAKEIIPEKKNTPTPAFKQRKGQEEQKRSRRPYSGQRRFNRDWISR